MAARLIRGFRYAFAGFLLSNGIYSAVLYYIPYEAVPVLSRAGDSVNLTPVYLLGLLLLFYVGYRRDDVEADGGAITRDLAFAGLGFLSLVAFLAIVGVLGVGEFVPLILLFGLCNLLAFITGEIGVRLLSVDAGLSVPP